MAGWSGVGMVPYCAGIIDSPVVWGAVSYWYGRGGAGDARR